jgi:hypothetical protein
MKTEFSRYEIPRLVDRPRWWQVRCEEIIALVDSVKKGHVHEIAVTPAGWSVRAVSYGAPHANPGSATWVSGAGSRNRASYKTNPEGPQVVMLVCGVHAAEAEAVAGAVNLISLLETGRDLRGATRPELVKLIANYRLIILPCVNMDGRAISPDHLRGASDEDFRKASQGIWKDGSPIGYPACKEYAPLPLERVGHPGGYTNSEGYNIMHDCSPGDIRTAEAKGLLNLVAEEQADLILHMHSHPIGGQILGETLMAYPLHVERVHQYKQRVFNALSAAGLRPAPVHGYEHRTGINLTTACCMASGGLSPIFEQPTTADWTFEEMLETWYVTVETFLKSGRTERFSPRDAVAKGEKNG